MEMEGDCLGNHWQPLMETGTPQPYPFMETVAAEIKAYGANILQQSNSYLLPFMETVRFKVELPRGKLEAVRTENQRLHIELGNSESEKEFFRQQVQELRSQLETERASREEITNLAPIAIGVEFPNAVKILSQLSRQAQKIYRNAGVMLRKF
jgi:predicted nuclease with TOPRIM domain